MFASQTERDRDREIPPDVEGANSGRLVESEGLGWSSDMLQEAQGFFISYHISIEIKVFFFFFEGVLIYEGFSSLVDSVTDGRWFFITIYYYYYYFG